MNSIVGKNKSKLPYFFPIRTSKPITKLWLTIPICLLIYGWKVEDNFNIFINNSIILKKNN